MTRRRQSLPILSCTGCLKQFVSWYWAHNHARKCSFRDAWGGSPLIVDLRSGENSEQQRAIDAVDSDPQF